MILSFLSETTGGSDMEFDKQQLEHFLTVSKVEKSATDNIMSSINQNLYYLQLVCKSNQSFVIID